ncbi:PPE family protein [Mycobacterium lacus]|uniref:Uncharacterized protein n=1 Tax=Mycobacterium lacus TaxID=169765 RepID=A0A1X1YTL3_9MYCO|nr:PPE family protein [Mycobacterium lacus]MCV7122939.1 PPE family protein [Mycobacterium lacus]ORW14467.1 hypothetical protein AWC15_13345 [Mycobacterium lacus]BBX95388.1 hypothetical protein MLAC_06820 [Mycobacterium lacus]
MTAPVWMASPPEVHSALLSSGPGPGSLLAAAAAWSSLSAEYAAVAADLSALLAAVRAGVWRGPSADSFAAAYVPYLAWLTQAGIDSATAAAQHETLAAAYTAALAAMPTLPELAANHATHGVLVATNFFGINTIPIAVNEADYVRMWIQAATTMATYQTVSAAAVASTPQVVPAPQILKTTALTHDSGSGGDSGNATPIDDVIAEILKYISGGRIIWDPANGTLNGLPYDAYTDPGQPIWWLARGLEFFQDGEEFWKLLFTNPVAAIEFLFSILVFDLPTHIMQIVTWLAQSPQLLAVALGQTITALGAAAGFAGLAGLAAGPAAAIPVDGLQLAPAPPVTLPVAGTAPTVPTVSVSATAPASAPAPTSAAGTAASGTAPPPATGLPPLLVGGGPGIGFGSGHSTRARTAEPASDSAVAAAAARASAREEARARRRRRTAAKERGHRDEFADMELDFGSPVPPADEQHRAWASDEGVGRLGFAEAVCKQAVVAAVGLTTVAGDGFGDGPRMPMVPRTWDPESDARG